MPDILSVILRALSFILLFQAAGVAIYIALFRRRLDRSQHAVRRIGQAAALAGVVLVAGHYALEAARLAGDMSGVWDPTLQEMMWHSPSRAALLCRLLGLLLIAVGLQGGSNRSTIVAVCGQPSSFPIPNGAPRDGHLGTTTRCFPGCLKGWLTGPLTARWPNGTGAAGPDVQDGHQEIL